MKFTDFKKNNGFLVAATTHGFLWIGLFERGILRTPSFENQVYRRSWEITIMQLTPARGTERRRSKDIASTDHLGWFKYVSSIFQCIATLRLCLEKTHQCLARRATKIAQTKGSTSRNQPVVYTCVLRDVLIKKPANASQIGLDVL